MDLLRRLLPYLRPHRRNFTLACLVMAAVSGLNGGAVWVLRTVVNSVFERRDPQLLLVAVALIPAVFFLKMILTWTQTYLMSRIGLSVTRRIREDLFRRLHELSMDFFWNNKSGETLSRLTNDLSQLGVGIHFLPVYLVRDCLTVAVVVAVMFAIRWQFALIALTALPLAGGVLCVLGWKLGPRAGGASNSWERSTTASKKAFKACWRSRRSTARVG